MKWFNNLKVSSKVLLACLIFLILILVISANSYYNMKKAGAAFDNFYNNRFLAALQLGNSNIDVQKIKAYMLIQQRAAERKDLQEIEKINAEIKVIAADYQKNISAFMALQMPENEKKLAEQFTAGAKYAVEARNKYAENLKILNTAESAKWLMEYIDRFGKAVGNIEQLVEIQMKEGKRIQEIQDQDIKQTNIIILVILCSALLIGFIITIVLSRSVSGPVKKGLAFAELLAAGNFLERIDLDQKDELGQLGKALNLSADNLEKLISEIIFASQNLVRAVEEIASGNENLSQRTSEQASSLEEIAATVEEANASTKQNSGNAVEASKLSDNSSKMAIEGGQIVEKAVFAIGEINNSSKKISEILNMINEIAFQTNLLALNAAVEAARAGEQGRGFAVVAGEVRNLAQRAASAAKDIGALIKDSISKIDEGTDLVNKSGEALKEIIASAKQVNDIISEIAASSDEQSRGIEQINTAITDMDTMTQQNAALVEETAAASEEMSNQAQELLSMVQQFKIREGMRSEVKLSKQEVHIHKLKTQTKDVPKEAPDKKQPAKPAKTEVKNGGAYNPESDGYEKF
jgi:methyl-accepting chemotaxis protein